jgi:phosphoglucomutase
MPGSVAAKILAGLANKRTAVSALAGKQGPREGLADVTRLEREYFDRSPDPLDRKQLLNFGASEHRGSPLNGSFREAHILAIIQAVCDYQRSRGVNGPRYMGKDAHALSGPSQRTALEVLAGTNAETFIRKDEVTPVISSPEQSLCLTEVVRTTSGFEATLVVKEAKQVLGK